MKTYTVAQAAERCGISAHTLRYYDKAGILPFVDRSPSGNRQFKDSDFEWLRTVNCLKDTGMPLKKIRDYIDLCMLGDSALDERLQFLLDHKRDVEQHRAELDRNLDTIDHKIWYYETAIEAGTTAVHRKDAAINRVKQST